MKRFFCSLLLFSFISISKADEGMWLPILLKSIEGDMQASGLKLTAEDIYSVNRSSLKDAIAVFGSGCTVELISEQGLMITNQHCGEGYIKSFSTVDNNLLEKGYWSKNKSEEIPCGGLSFTFMIRMEDVTQKMLKGIIANNLSDAQRAEKIRLNMATVIQETAHEPYQSVVVRPFYNGNEYYAFVIEEYSDVRFVATPPRNIGNFGGDTDNWVWPRHNADFNLFRLYMSPDGKPAKYSKDNVPYKPKHFLPISIRGVKENDFTMVYGFPGRTSEYISSYAIDLITNVDNPIRVGVREEGLRIMREDMRSNDTIGLAYLKKYATIANGWKMWKGQTQGLKKTNAIRKKAANEAIFKQKIAEDPHLKLYENILFELQKAYTFYKPFRSELVWFDEIMLFMEHLQTVKNFQNLLKLQASNTDADKIKAEKEKVKNAALYLFKDYSPETELKIMKAILPLYAQAVNKEKQPLWFREMDKKYNGNWDLCLEDYFANTAFMDKTKFLALLENPEPKIYEKDPAFLLGKSAFEWQEKELQPQWTQRATKIDSLNRVYMEAQRAVFKDKAFYPDANSTLRLTYGKAEGFLPQDGVRYRYFTTLDGVFEKEQSDPTNPDYHTNARLKELWEKGDFGDYAYEDGKIHTCFIASNHTTGGNSGSPVLDGEGNLIGLNFDRCWEGTMSDVNYDVSLCRNISVDAKYILFIIDKFAGASHIIEELKIVR